MCFALSPVRSRFQTFCVSCLANRGLSILRSSLSGLMSAYADLWVVFRGHTSVSPFRTSLIQTLDFFLCLYGMYMVRDYRSFFFFYIFFDKNFLQSL